MVVYGCGGRTFTVGRGYITVVIILIQLLTILFTTQMYSRNPFNTPKSRLGSSSREYLTVV